MADLIPIQEEMIHLRHAAFEHRRVKDVVVALGSPTDLGRTLSATASEGHRRGFWKFLDLYDPATPLPSCFRFRVTASLNRLASITRLEASAGLLVDAFPSVRHPDEDQTSNRLPAVCFRFRTARGGMVLFGDDGSLPSYPHWHVYWPQAGVGDLLTFDNSRIVSARLARWSEWVHWAAALPGDDPLTVTPPVGLSVRDRLLYDLLASVLGPSPPAGHQQLLRRAEGHRWVVASNDRLATAVGLTPRQVQSAIRSLVSAGLAERLSCTGDGAAWGVRLLAD
jgi:hypothetical protein